MIDRIRMKFEAIRKKYKASPNDRSSKSANCFEFVWDLIFTMLKKIWRGRAFVIGKPSLIENCLKTQNRSPFENKIIEDLTVPRKHKIGTLLSRWSFVFQIKSRYIKEGLIRSHQNCSAKSFSPWSKEDQKYKGLLDHGKNLFAEQFRLLEHIEKKLEMSSHY